VYPNLRAEIRRKGLSESDFATEVVGISSSLFSLKITGRNSFKQREIERIIDYFNMAYEYIFTKCV
jgi:hypothetical protein